MAESPDHTPSVARSLLRISGPAVVVVALVSIGLGGWWLNRDQGPVGGATRTVTGADSTSVDTPDRGATLLTQARLALKERRLLAPAGDNAIEYYLQIVGIESTHAAARQALLELIPPATAAVDSVIAAGELDEARRQMELLRRMGASELNLGPLRTRLEQARSDAVRALTLERAGETALPAPSVTTRQTVVAVAATVPPSAPPAATPATTTASPAPVAAAALSGAAPANPAAGTATADPPLAPTPAPASTAAANATVQEPRQIVDARPTYPSAAVQRRVEGWVELEVSIGADGNVAEVSVVRSEPTRIFDREAVRAAQRWRFTPRLENGVAVASRVRKTVAFKLAAG